MTCRTPAGVGSTIVTLWLCRRWVTASKRKREVVRPVMTVRGTPCAAIACPTRSKAPMWAVAMITPCPRRAASAKIARSASEILTSRRSCSGFRWRRRSNSPKLRADMRKIRRAIASSSGSGVPGPITWRRLAITFAR